MRKNKTDQERISYLLNEHVKYLNRYLRRLELREPSKDSILWNFINDEIEATKRYKELVDQQSKKKIDYERELKKHSREITHLQLAIKEIEKTIKELHEKNKRLQKENDTQKNQIRTLREENNFQRDFVRTVEYDLMKVVGEKNNLEKVNLSLMLIIERFQNEKEGYDEEDEIKNEE